MRLRNLASFTIAVFLGSLLALLAPAPAALAQGGMKVDNATCLGCHETGKRKIEVPGPGDEARTLTGVPKAGFAKSVHAKLQCVECHTGLVEFVEAIEGHTKPSAREKQRVDCVECHFKLWDNAKAEGKAAEKPRLAKIVENAGAHAKSWHGRKNVDNVSGLNASCNDCHNVHTFDIPAAGSPQRAEWRLGGPQLCGKCHEDALDEYKESVHGQEVLTKKNPKAAMCFDCHSSHSVDSTSDATFQVAVSSRCGNCHTESLKSYRATYHGQVNKLGYGYTAKCYDCHGYHDILRVSDPDSKVAGANRLKTCRSCHNPDKGLPEASEGFTTFLPHATNDDFFKYPQMWLAAKMMIGLLAGTFAFFWTHTLLWFYREYKERKERKLRPHVKVDELPESLRGRHFQRFTRTWRIAHLTFALSLMTLTISGMPLLFSNTEWAYTVMKWFGGPRVAGEIHRVAALFFVAVFIWHLFYIGIRIGRNFKEFKLFGPHSMVPNLNDLRDIYAMFEWFLGQGPRPKFDRWTYWEKFDYWAPFWGVTIIGVSGLMMWIPSKVAAFLPGWVFNVAAIFHGEEAILAVVFLFTVHFFNNHFRPDKFPLDVVMFTGAVPLEEFRHEHGHEYQRLLDSGELEKYLVDKPSRPMTIGSKILGFTLIAIGLCLLTLVAIGFFTH